MDPSEITKHLPEAISVAKVAAASIPFTGIVKRMLGPAADEVAEMWRDQVRVYRYERQVKLLEKVERMAHEAGFTPQAVPPKVLFPLLEGASFEEDESLHDMWAALLANAASPEHTEAVRPGFIAILKQMAPDEAALLLWLNDQQTKNDSTIVGTTRFRLLKAQSALNFAGESTNLLSSRMVACLDGLEAEQLIRRSYVGDLREQERGPKPLNFVFVTTERGLAFIEACQPPKPKS